MVFALIDTGTETMESGDSSKGHLNPKVGNFTQQAARRGQNQEDHGREQTRR